MPLLEGKKVLIAGIANHRSIGWAIAQAFAREGAQLAFTYQERMEKYVKELAEKIPNTPTILCDVQSDEQIDSAFEKAGELFGGILPDHARRFSNCPGHQRLFTGGDGTPSRAAHAGQWRRQHIDTDLYGKRACNAQV